ncbi:homocysteine S-methyltransferase family protein [Pseudomonas sp. KCA11]|uniref:homocysteine S-methyltransferase family protein n=1 Tax=unclassified Pseudomonas TaxID=196821 RepID=UPI001F2AE01D|nr:MULTISPECIES: homocysteine S-methyltransferase family protein [unclassified Pseudomonas]MCE5992993.1 homocysteine S-methyltransferase family protein [Pseudomonas sp. KCA11]UMY63781.1 homocysteine S-methyltransferase family protein [Pseudomonas sp. LS.1a]
MTQNAWTLLDGGMGRELKRIGAPFRQPEWSALALLEAPEYVAQVHRAFIAAGASVITTNSYAVVPFHIGEERFARSGRALAGLSGQLARGAADEAVAQVRVAGSLPPALGSYRPDLFDPVRSQAIHRELISGLAPYVDFWLAETQSSLAEARAVHAALDGECKPLWLSFTLLDPDTEQSQPLLRSGESVEQAVLLALELGASALLFNCSQPESMGAALHSARQVLKKQARELPLGVYANAFPPVREDAQANDTLLDIRADLGPEAYLQWAQQWVEEGATIVGGCCGIGPEHIAQLNHHLQAHEEIPD